MSDLDLFHQEPLWEEGGDLPGALEALFTAAVEVLDLPRLRELTGLGDGALLPQRVLVEEVQVAHR